MSYILGAYVIMKSPYPLTYVDLYVQSETYYQLLKNFEKCSRGFWSDRNIVIAD